MANWEKLNKEFYDVLESFTDIQWDEWMDSRATKKAMRDMDLKIKALKTLSKEIESSKDWEKVIIGQLSTSKKAITNSVVVKAEASTFDCNDALAA